MSEAWILGNATQKLQNGMRCSNLSSPSLNKDLLYMLSRGIRWGCPVGSSFRTSDREQLGTNHLLPMASKKNSLTIVIKMRTEQIYDCRENFWSSRDGTILFWYVVNHVNNVATNRVHLKWRTIQSQGRAFSGLNKSSHLGAVGVKGVVIQNWQQRGGGRCRMLIHCTYSSKEGAWKHEGRLKGEQEQRIY